jgi:hypothetical protein
MCAVVTVIFGVYNSVKVKVRVKVTLRLTVSQSVSLSVEPHLGLMTWYVLLFDSYGLVFVGPHNETKPNIFFYIFRLVHYRDNNAGIDRKANSCDRLWEIRPIFDTLNDAYESYSNLSEHLDAEEIILKFKVRVVTWDCAFSNASRSTIKWTDSVR